MHMRNWLIDCLTSQRSSKSIISFGVRTAGAALMLWDTKALWQSCHQSGDYARLNLLDDVNLEMHRAVLWEFYRKQWPDEGDLSKARGRVFNNVWSIPTEEGLWKSWPIKEKGKATHLWWLQLSFRLDWLWTLFRAHRSFLHTHPIPPEVNK